MTDLAVYSRMPEYDVSVYATASGVVCALCNFGDMMTPVFIAESTTEMIGHLEAHAKKGDIIPEKITSMLIEDDKKNYPNQG